MANFMTNKEEIKAMGIQKLLHKFALLAINGNGGPGGPPFEVNRFPPEPDENGGQPEFTEEEEPVELKDWTEEEQQIYKDILLDIQKWRALIKKKTQLKEQEEKEKKEKDSGDLEEK